MIEVKGDRVLVRPDKAETKSAGGLELVTQQAENYQTGTVEAVGPGKALGNGQTAGIPIAIGDRVLFLRHSANMVKAGDDLYVIPYAEVLAILED